MPYSFEQDRLGADTLPTDVTLRTTIYRRRGVIASLIFTALAAWSARRQLKAITRHYRRKPLAPIPEYLREDIGLPPLPPRSPTWWELRP